MCPLCHSNKVRRSHRQPFDLLLQLIFRAKPMRCRTCSHRYYRWPWSKPEEGNSADLPLAETPNQSAAAAAAATSSGKR
jgi:hypothetical protein